MASVIRCSAASASQAQIAGFANEHDPGIRLPAIFSKCILLHSARKHASAVRRTGPLRGSTGPSSPLGGLMRVARALYLKSLRVFSAFPRLRFEDKRRSSEARQSIFFNLFWLADCFYISH